MLTPANMRTFAAVVEEGTFSAAAARLNATQSGVSQQVARLERGLGVTLLVRGPQGSIPTPAGRQLYRRSVQILRDLAAAETALRHFVHGVSGSIRVGLMPALTRALSGPVLRRFMAEHTNVCIALTELVSSTLIDETAAGRIDLGIVPAFNTPDAIRMSPLGSTREVLVHRGRNHCDHMREVSLPELSSLRLILQSAGNIRRETILARLKAANVAVAEVLDLDSMFGTLEFVEHSDFATILPAIMLAPEIESANLCVRPICTPPLHLELIAIEPSGREQSPIAPLLTARFSEHVELFNEVVANRLRR